MGGAARGLKLAGPGRVDGIRPTSDKVREALFNMINVEGGAFLDLFGGTGAVACEAVSRGAESVAIVENSKRAVAIIKKNVFAVTAAQDIKTKVEIHCADVPEFLAGEASCEASGGRYDFIFCDPPYDRPDAGFLLEETTFFLKPDGVFILETSSKKFPELKKEPFKIKRYGDTTLLFF